MFKLKRQPTVVSANDFVTSVLTGEYRWKYPEAKLLVKILLAHESLLASVKQDLKLGWDFIEKNINNLTLVCKDPDIAKLAAQVIDTESFTFGNFRLLFGTASQNKSEDFVVNLLNYNGNLKLDIRKYGDTLLHVAAQKGLVNVCQALVERGLDVNSKNRYYQTPLHLAVREDHLGVVELLISAGADLNAKSSSGWTPLHWVACNGYLEVVKLLISAGADVNAKIDSGWTPLHWAACNGYLEVVALLISAGADVNARDNKGWTPLHWAACYGNFEFIKVLLRYGANMNAKDRNSKTLLELANYKTRKAIRQYLAK